VILPNASRKLVLFLPRRDDPSRGEPYSADLLPLELLQIAGGPAAEGFEIVLLDAMVEEDYLEQVLEACEGALLLACSSILGYQVLDGYRVARAVRERHPRLPIVWGGWFPSVAPQLYFEAGIADAVALGQGELTFLEVVRAIASGCDLEEVPGLALWRDGGLVRTARRPVEGFERLPPVPWQLLDFGRYADRQLRTSSVKVRHRLPSPLSWTGTRPPVSFSYFSSFGCPEPCTYCCSPRVSGRRWKALPGRRLAGEISELQERFGFDVVRFSDANWGVSERRAREFAQELAELGTRLHWNATIEIETVMRYREETLDLVRDSGCHLLWLGVETATAAMQERIRKRINVGDVPVALSRLVDRGITAGSFWIIGFPGETPESMEETLRQAARTKHRFPGCCAEVYPFRPLPGTEDYEEALRLGWSMPRDLEGWSRFFEWKWHTEGNPLPPRVRERWRRYIQTAAIYDRHVSEGPQVLRSLLARLAGWRLARGWYGLTLEQKLFHLLARRIRDGSRERAPR